MMKYLCHKYVLLLTVTLILPFWGVGGSTVMAQGQDPTLAAMILLYTDKAKGILSEQRFMKLTATMEQEQEENQRRLQELLRMLQQSDAQESEVRTFIREIRQYATIQELDETVLNRLISRILVGEVRKVDGQKVQEVRIVYNFVGEIV